MAAGSASDWSEEKPNAALPELEQVAEQIVGHLELGVVEEDQP